MLEGHCTVGGTTLDQMALGYVKDKLCKPVNNVPQWPLLQFLPLGSWLEFLLVITVSLESRWNQPFPPHFALVTVFITATETGLGSSTPHVHTSQGWNVSPLLTPSKADIFWLPALIISCGFILFCFLFYNTKNKRGAASAFTPCSVIQTGAIYWYLFI